MSAMQDVEILRAACCVAGLDEQITDSERGMLKRLANHAGVGAVSLEAMIDRAVSDPDFYQEQFEMVRTDPDATMKALFCVAVADRELTTDERVILHHFAAKLGMAPERFDQLLAAARKHIDRNRT